jgi:hypothetical protein
MLPDPSAFDEMHRSLGKALTRWQYVETGLYIIAHGLMETSHNISSLAFFQIKSAENKLEFVDRMIFTRLSQRQRVSFWKPISKEIGAAIAFRNYLAHFEIFRLDKKHMIAMMPPTKYPVALSSHHLDEHKHRHGGMITSLSVEIIEHNSEELRRVTYSLIYFAIDHIPYLERSEASLPPNLRRWLGSFRKTARPPEFPPPLKSSRE